ncbi:hypothetical protein O181_007381 [Austropuccinia psidii MF-1]|uniref:Uncharacterized protein n=1 Tax=Austropuccinia psidii MF-1 TaxID=1389203 RepID=A0A9Q3GHJ8_9BASI|nr:hypothetical protein [Austropuccinia psidii MF-1]
MLPFTFQLNRNLKPEHWTYINQAIKLHQLLKDLFQWIMYKRFNLASHWEEPWGGFQRIFLEEKPFKEPMVITKGFNPNRKFKLLKEREARIRENKGTIHAIEEKLNQKENTLIPSSSQGVNQPDSQVALNHSSTSK